MANLKAFVVFIGDPLDGADLVYHKTASKARAYSLQHGYIGSEADSLIEIGVRREDRADLFAAAVDSPCIEMDNGRMREAGFNSPDGRDCDICGLNDMDLHQWRVCDECGRCPECGHEEDCAADAAESEA